MCFHYSPLQFKNRLKDLQLKLALQVSNSLILSTPSGNNFEHGIYPIN